MAGSTRRTSDLPAATRMQMPADWARRSAPIFWAASATCGTFQCPAGPGVGRAGVAGGRAAAVGGPCGDGRTKLLGDRAAERPPQRFDITHRLEPHNRLEIFVDHPADVELDGDEVGDAAN